jgi:hypothetical protein
LYIHPNNLLHLLLKFINEKFKKPLLACFIKSSVVNVRGFNNNYNSFLSTTPKATP